MPTVFTRRPVSGRGRPPGRFILQEWKAQHSKLKVLPSHRLAGEPSAPVWFTFRSARGIRTRTAGGLSAVTPANWSRAPCE
jgi:hypothetical protein